MSIESPDQPPSSVRVELFEEGPIASDGIEMPDRSRSSNGRWPAMAMVVGVLGLVAGLWWLSGPGADEASGDSRGEGRATEIEQDRFGDDGVTEGSDARSIEEWES